MAKLPKIVRDRLRQGSKRSPVDLRSAANLSASLGGGRHPDANLLAAFAERRLAGSERTLLLGHLADCAQCRELVALAFPSPEVQAAVAEATRPGSGSPVWLRWPVWLGWGTLRWGVLAASVGVVLIGGFRAGVLRWPAPQSSGSMISKSPVVENKQPSVLRAANDSSSSARGASSPRRELAEVAQVPPAKRAHAFSKERDESRRAGQASAAQSQALTPSGLATLSDSLRAEKADSLPQQKSLGLRTAEVQAEATSKEKIEPASKASEAGRRRLSAMTQALTLPPPPPPATPGVVGAPQTLRFDQVRELAKDKRLLTAQWSIASVVGPYVDDSSPAIGRVERSLDGGKTWQELRVNDRVSFRAVAANGTEVWAGGSRGALYHSSDGGQHWARAPVGLGQGVVTDTIVGIDVGDRGHVRVTTEARETLVTADGGLHWKIR